MYDNSNRYGSVDRQTKKEQRRADAWKWNESMERVASLRSSDPDAYDRMGPLIRISLGHYENDKKIAAQYGRDVNKGGN
ncbi:MULTISPECIES: hypothetical protein [unclassified Streptomyces]|uniref:hypothetical protein n=1 Tax=unclassified Streptomyces TaxID=2593676 RepID=UPI0013A6A8B0|nr:MULTISPECIES: hypothetical protein [unclassified Streptomyces]